MRLIPHKQLKSFSKAPFIPKRSMRFRVGLLHFNLAIIFSKNYSGSLYSLLAAFIELTIYYTGNITVQLKEEDMSKYLLPFLFSGLMIQGCELIAQEEDDETASNDSSSEILSSSNSNYSSETGSSSSVVTSGEVQRVVGSELYEVISMTDNTLEYQQDYWECLDGSPNKTNDLYTVDYSIDNNKIEISAENFCHLTYYEGNNPTAIGSWEYKGEYAENPNKVDEGCDPDIVALTNPDYVKEYNIIKNLSATELKEDFDITFTCYAQFFMQGFEEGMTSDEDIFLAFPDLSVNLIDCSSFEVDWGFDYKQTFSFNFHGYDFDMTTTSTYKDKACSMTEENFANSIIDESNACTQEILAFEQCNNEIMMELMEQILGGSLNKFSIKNAVRKTAKKVQRVIRSI